MNMNRLSLLSGSAIVACAVAISATACAQDAREFNIPAGSLRDALNLFATQSDQQILFSGDLVAGRTTPGLTGRFAPRDALDRLLAGSGISWSQGRPGVIFLRRSTETLANTETVTALEDIIVTGTLLKRSGDLASPVVVFDRDALDRRGFGTVAEVLTDLPQNYAGSGTPIVQMTASDRQGSNAVNATGVNLRGLGPASTLTLVNGRRVAGTGFRGEFGDVSALPSAAVERVDVLLDGASALYGADAVAGVVNVVMRQVFDGQESRARVIEHLALRSSWGTSFRAASLPQIHDASVLSLTTVPRGDGGSVLALYQYGGNADLKPETADTFTIGFDYRPRGGLNLSAGYFETRFTDRIAQPATENLAGVLTDPALAPFVTRVSPGSSAADLALVQSYISRPDFAFGTLYPATSYGAIIDGRWVNTGAVRVNGFDLSARFPFSMGEHRITLDGSASYVLGYESQTTPTAMVREVVDLIGYPVRLRSRIGAGWSRGDWSADLHWNHVGDYRDRLGARIDAWNTADLRAGWAPGTGVLYGLRLALTVQNLFDRDPPFYNAPSGFGFDPGQSSLMGRTVALQLIKRW